ncbi:beta-galactosidase [Candidatus Kaiserbacteria bacterium]|nr:MAG: beta-galactosidase [Candidatus Kaiserbacteria bacterium]
MKRWLLRTLAGVAVLCTCVLITLVFLARKEKPEHITYGISYNVPYVLELGLNPDDVFDAFLNELNVRYFRLSAHWTLIEPDKDDYDFAWMDRDIQKAETADAKIIFGVGRRLPRWPECHIPSWAQSLSWEDKKVEIREYITAVVNRYKDSKAITHWQVENEPYLGLFAYDHCGDIDESFLEEEIALVKSLDPTRPILVTDSGNLGTWNGAYSHGDSFGTSVYVYFWNPELGQFKTILPPWFYRVKENIMALIHGEKETFLIELSLEPWLLEPVTEVPVETQYSRMDMKKFNEIIEYARDTRYETQFLWGGEWWYWLREQGHPEMWERGIQLFNQ